MKRLATLSGAYKIKFFGKIFGSQHDYLVAQGRIKTVKDPPSKNLHQELEGTGVNTNVYWVTTNILGDWVQLPEASPE